MTTHKFLSLKSFTVHKSQVLIPNQIETGEWIEQLKDGVQVYMEHIQSRDLGMHNGYFMILGYIHDRLPSTFRSKIPKKHFYKFIKTLSKEYDVIYLFKDGVPMIEYKSISFAKMNQESFRQYFNNQLSIIYEEILIPMNKDYLMDEINAEFEKMLSKLI